MKIQSLVYFDNNAQKLQYSKKNVESKNMIDEKHSSKLNLIYSSKYHFYCE